MFHMIHAQHYVCIRACGDLHTHMCVCTCLCNANRSCMHSEKMVAYLKHKDAVRVHAHKTYDVQLLGMGGG